MLVCIAVAEILAILIKKAEIIDMAANFVTLGICFLSGIFVPLELLGEGVKKAAQVAPTYWYAKAVDDIFGLTSFTGEKLRPVFVSLGILLAFIYQDNRAFCKYLCPITVFLKPMSYFALIRVKCDESKCISCGKCRKVCPMEVDMLDPSKRRKNGTECILCLECKRNCPVDAL